MSERRWRRRLPRPSTARPRPSRRRGGRCLRGRPSRPRLHRLFASPPRPRPPRRRPLPPAHRGVPFLASPSPGTTCSPRWPRVGSNPRRPMRCGRAGWPASRWYGCLPRPLPSTGRHPLTPKARRRPKPQPTMPTSVPALRPLRSARPIRLRPHRGRPRAGRRRPTARTLLRRPRLRRRPGVTPQARRLRRRRRGPRRAQPGAGRQRCSSPCTRPRRGALPSARVSGRASRSWT